MIKVSELTKQQNVIIVNTFSQYGALTSKKNMSLNELLEIKKKSHNTTQNFLNTSSIRIEQDFCENVFSNPMGLILSEGEIHFAVKGEDGDIGYDPEHTTIELLELNPKLTKPNIVDDLKDIVGPRDRYHNDILVIKPIYTGLFIWGNYKYSVDYNIPRYVDFCKRNNLSFYVSNLENDGKITSFDMVKRFTDSKFVLMG